MSRRTVPCPGCGLHVVLDAATNTILHESPMCAEFVRRVEASGLKTKREAWTVVVNPLTGEVMEPSKV